MPITRIASPQSAAVVEPAEDEGCWAGCWTSGCWAGCWGDASVEAVTYSKNRDNPRASARIKG
jgi:hypothetical protein